MGLEYPVAVLVADVEAGSAESAPRASGQDVWDQLRAQHLTGLHLRSPADPGGQFAALVDQLAPRTAVPGPAWLLQARRNATARHELLQEVGALTSEEVADLAGARAANRRATASRWAGDGQVFAVTHQGARLFPGFQFDLQTHKPKPIVRQVLKALPGQLVEGGWQLALWWTTPTAGLDWQRPVDLLDEQPERVLAAAAQERSDWMSAGAEPSATEVVADSAAPTAGSGERAAATTAPASGAKQPGRTGKTGRTSKADSVITKGEKSGSGRGAAPRSSSKDRTVPPSSSAGGRPAAATTGRAGRTTTSH